ncbi:P-loop containing nucleoside triphosphate hydrolase protein [Trametes meyenii]|nr:P-loop containing nucleoside triphosphate hydrolase protein [Trametes meyenii]
MRVRHYSVPAPRPRSRFTFNLFSEKHSQEVQPLTGGDGHSENGASTVAGDAPQPALPPPNLKIKRVDNYWSTWSDAWKYRNTGSGVIAEAVRPVGGGGANDPWQNFCFVVVRKFPQVSKHDLDPKQITFKIVIKSPYLLKACQDVVGEVRGISWTADPLELDPQLMLGFFPEFEAYEKELRNKQRSQYEEHVLATLDVLLDYFRTDYRATLAKIANLTSHGEITFELLYAILVPRSIVVTECPITGETRALQLREAKLLDGRAPECRPYRLLCESVDSLEEAIHGRNVDANANNADDGMQPTSHSSVPPSEGRSKRPGVRGVGGKTFGRVESVVYIEPFTGTRKIDTLAAYPLKYNSDPEGLRELLLARGRKWASLKGIHHVHYKGTAAIRVEPGAAQTIVKYSVDSRVMIDRMGFLRVYPDYPHPKPTEEESKGLSARDRLRAMRTKQGANPEDEEFRLDVRTSIPKEEAPLSDEDLVLASPILHGYSLSDKIWLEFNVHQVQPIVWNEEAFANLVLANDRKDLLRSLVDAHSANLGFDDFVQGKGQGLIINLFGPPGVGKTLSAEATSERVHRPLYVVGGGDLGTKAADVDAELTRVFGIATSWKAIVLIDEADVFLERRSLHDLERNAMVAVFLRHVEYYRGILFLTTNRVTAFDPAFLSRIHVALHFDELSAAARAQVWRAFLRKARVPVPVGSDLRVPVGLELPVGSELPTGDEHAHEVESDAAVRRLAARDVNGRQIKNACRTAQSLAHSRGEPLRVEHLEETLDAMEDFNVQFAAMARAQAQAQADGGHAQ